MGKSTKSAPFFPFLTRNTAICTQKHGEIPRVGCRRFVHPTVRAGFDYGHQGNPGKLLPARSDRGDVGRVVRRAQEPELIHGSQKFVSDQLWL
jgi:hypothetical protein